MDKKFTALFGVLTGVVVTLLIVFAVWRTETAGPSFDADTPSFAGTAEVEHLSSDESYLAGAPPDIDYAYAQAILEVTGCGDLVTEAMKVDVWRSARVVASDYPKVEIADYYLDLIATQIWTLGYCGASHLEAVPMHYEPFDRYVDGQLQLAFR